MRRISPPLLLCLALAGCGLTPQPDTRLVAELSRLPYPKDAALGPDLDILVYRDGGTIQLANRTPQSYRGMLLWLNQQYVARVPVVAIGPDNRYDLSGFINRHGESFPVGSLLAPDKAFPVVLAELFDPAAGQRHRLTVVSNK